MEEKEISLDELAEMAKRKGPKVSMPLFRATATALIIDKDGNVKGEMTFDSEYEVEEDATE
jgi:hypothetical protein